MMASCWASFWPKKALSGVTMLNSLETTVQTPLKWVGRVLPHRALGISDWISTKVAAPSGYISSTEGWNTREAPCASSRAQSRSKSRG